MAFCVLDCKKVGHYPLPAGLYRQSVLADRIKRTLEVSRF